MMHNIWNTPHLITTAKMTEIELFLEARNRGVRLTGDADAKQAKKVPVNANGITTIPVYGSLFKRANILTEFSGGTSYEILASQIQAAARDSEVKKIILDIDSPGGAADGVLLAANAIAQCGKPVIASVNGLAASAAYWLACSCSEIWACDDITQVGSVGVVAKYMDRTQRNEQEGFAVTTIKCGKYKTAGSPDHKMSEDEQAYLQSDCDDLMTAFVSHVASCRGIDPKVVADTEAKVFQPNQAKELGLIDGVKSLAELQAPKGGGPMDRAELQNEHPGIVLEIEQDARKAERTSIENRQNRVLKVVAANPGTTTKELHALLKGDEASCLSAFPGCAALVKEELDGGLIYADGAAIILAEAGRNVGLEQQERVEAETGGPVPPDVATGSDAGLETEEEKHLCQYGWAELSKEQKKQFKDDEAMFGAWARGKKRQEGLE